MKASSTTSGDVLLSARGIVKNYGHVQALGGADFELRDREIHALIGDNGAGKSTLIKVFSGDVRPDKGVVEIDGLPVRFSSPRDAQVAGIETVYQDLALASTLDTGMNIFLGREILVNGPLAKLGFINAREMRRQAAEQLKDLGIELPSVSVPVSDLSGGQRQAVAVARAAAWGRRVLIMDEPVAALAPQQTEHVLSLMRRARDERGLAVIFISHNLPHVFLASDRVTVLRHGQTVLTKPTAETDVEELLRAMTGLGSERRASA
jgi:simple sugar transport system ATP-binding protein